MIAKKNKRLQKIGREGGGGCAPPRLILFDAFIYQVEVVIRSRLVAIKKRHEKKLLFNIRRHNVNASDSAVVTKQIIHNFSSCNLSRDRELALCYGQDQHIPNNATRNTIKTEFELFYQGLLKNISHIPEEQISAIKTKLRRTCEIYCSIHVPHDYKKVIERLSRNNDIIIMKQGKGSGVAIMNKPKFHEKCLELLNTDQFTKLNHDPTK